MFDGISLPTGRQVAIHCSTHLDGGLAMARDDSVCFFCSLKCKTLAIPKEASVCAATLRQVTGRVVGQPRPSVTVRVQDALGDPPAVVACTLNVYTPVMVRVYPPLPKASSPRTVPSGRVTERDQS